MSTITPPATALNRAWSPRGVNSHDELPGEGPAWACARFGHYGHNSITCIDCISNFMDRPENTKGDNA